MRIEHILPTGTMTAPDPQQTIRKLPVNGWVGVWPDPLTRRRARLPEGPVAGPEHERCHRADADGARRTAAEAACDCGEAPDRGEEVADQAPHGVSAALRHTGATLGDGGGGPDGSNRGAFVEALPVRGRFADHQAACWAFSAASRSAMVALLCMPSISATRLIVSPSARVKPTPPAPVM